MLILKLEKCIYLKNHLFEFWKIVDNLVKCDAKTQR